MTRATQNNLTGLTPANRWHTHTRDGNIPHLRLVSRDGSITLYAPVKLLPARRGEDVPRPMRDREGRTVFALPAGGEFAA